MRRLILFMMATWFLGAEATAETRVADVLRFRLYSGNASVPSGGFHALPLALKRGDRLELAVRLDSSVSGIGAYVCSASELEKFKQNLPTETCRGFKREKFGGAFEYEVFFSGNYVFVVDNMFANFFEKKVSYEVTINTRVSEQDTADLTKSLSETYALLKTGFEFTDFDLLVAPCGQMNAFSEKEGGNVTICSELLFEADRAISPDAVTGIFFHELGHTFLNLWGEPNYQNEQTADEFSTVLMILSGQGQVAENYIAFFSGISAQAEAIAAELGDSPHPLSIQRMRNVGHILDAPEEYTKRWIPVLYRNMSTAGLESEISSPSKYSDVPLATRILKSNSAN